MLHLQRGGCGGEWAGGRGGDRGRGAATPICKPSAGGAHLHRAVGGEETRGFHKFPDSTLLDSTRHQVCYNLIILCRGVH